MGMVAVLHVTDQYFHDYLQQGTVTSASTSGVYTGSNFVDYVLANNKRRLSIMANGTIAFDTLTTSDSVNTNTEKSIDTSYIYNGVAKHWITLDGSGTVTVLDSFNNF